jgi:hypothetical protein
LLNPFVLAMLDAGHGLPLRRAVDEQACRRSGRCDRDEVYTIFEIHPLLADEFVRRRAMSGGLVWHFARPPVQGLDFEVDVRRVACELVI